MQNATGFLHRRALPALITATLALAACSGNGPASVPRPTVGPQQFVQIDKGAGGFYSAFGGPQRASLDALRGTGTYSVNGASFTFDATMAGNVVDGNTNFYVWGINRGAATNAPFPGEPNVIFDAVVALTVQPNGAAAAAITLIPGGPAGTVDPSAIAIAGPNVHLTVPVAPFKPTGSGGPATFVWNLWPRTGVGGPPAQVASFLPENAMAPFVALP